MKKTKGFTLVELIIVIVIVGILSIVAVPIYRGYTKKAIGSEAKALVGSINTAEKVYYAEYGDYLYVTATSYNIILDIDARSNKYFKLYTVASTAQDGAGFNAIVNGEGAAKDITVMLSAGKEGYLETFSTGLE